MMSLFSSFDLYFFPLSFLLFIYMLFNVFCKIFFSQSSWFLLNFVLEKFESFFLTLKIKSFNKNFLLFLIVNMMFLFLVNLTSVFSYNFAISSQLSIVLFLGLTSWITFVMFSLFNSFKGFMSHCVPEGTPLYLVWFLFLIELVSNSIRPVTITVRLVANILAGHLLLILLSKLVMSYSYTIMFYFILNVVEFLVAIIQSYIFSTMIALYYSEVN